ncbi:MAG TPA: alpha/beta fold hydrolase [Acidimicrobiales bacterium]|jgi:pimeloyl-ACP methyl ester carboxylesterase|nr:alpha/beta fold hydrolase [Acidimicrobiales bacterium]
MGLFFEDPLFEEFTMAFALGFTSHGELGLGEVRATCARILDGNDDSWFAAWCETADRLVEAGDVSAKGGHTVSAREAYVRASVSYAVAYHPLFGVPVDSRLVEAFGKQRSAFDKAAVLFDPAGESLVIPFDGAQMPAYFFHAPGTTGRRPLVVATNGYDATLYELFLANAVPALRRGYHCLIFDGPGQGAVLFEQGIPIRADWEAVVGPVIDAAVGREDVDPDRIVLVGTSLGGYLALRAASGERRLAACVADPGLLSIASGMVGRLGAAGVSEEVIERYPDIPEDVLAPVAEAIHADRSLRWAVEQRGFWVHGVNSLAEYLRATVPFDLTDHIAAIRCPTAITAAENDPLARTGQQIYDALPGKKALFRFQISEGAGDHCEVGNRSLLDQRIFDWLDEVL